MTNKTRTGIIIASVAALIAVAAFSFFLLNITQNGQELRQQIDALAAQNEQAASLLRLQRLAQDTATARSELSQYFLLRESDSITFLTEIESLAPQVGLTLETESLRQVNVDNSDWIEVVFNVSGARGDVENFVKILEIIPYVSQVESVQMNVVSTSRWEATITIRVQLLSYDS